MNGNDLKQLMFSDHSPRRCLTVSDRNRGGASAQWQFQRAVKKFHENPFSGARVVLLHATILTGRHGIICGRIFQLSLRTRQKN
jgi:hypothetical protein